jgi:hypothetical protein
MYFTNYFLVESLVFVFATNLLDVRWGKCSAGRLSVLLQWRLVVFFFLIEFELAKYSVFFLVIFSV